MGEIIDRSASVWRANWKALFKLFLGFQLATYLLTKGWQLAAKTYFPKARGGAQFAEALKGDPLEALTEMGIGTGAGLGLMVISLFGSTFVAVAATRYVYPQLVGQRATLGESLAFAWSRVGSILGFFLLMGLWTLLVTVLALLPAGALIGGGFLSEDGPARILIFALGGLLAMGALGIVVLWFLLRFMLGAQVLALEEVGAIGAFRRSNALSSGRIGPGILGLTKIRLGIVFTVVAMIVLTVSYLFSIPQVIIVFVYANPFNPAGADLDAIPGLLGVPAELVQVIAQTAITPLWVVFDIVFYTDMRVRREGLDLEVKLEAAPA